MAGLQEAIRGAMKDSLRQQKLVEFGINREFKAAAGYHLDWFYSTLAEEHRQASMAAIRKMKQTADQAGKMRA